VLDDEAAEITTAGSGFFTEFGIELPAAFDPPPRRAGSASTGPSDAHTSRVRRGRDHQRYFDLGWMERMKRSHAVVVTPWGRRGFRETFGIDALRAGPGRFDRRRSVASARPPLRV
jgi:hypothetical protein